MFKANDIFSSSKKVVLIAPPGWGKTRLAIRLLKQFKSGIIVERTVEEIKNVLRLAEADSVNIIPLFSRYYVCPIRRDAGRAAFYRFCISRRRLGLCSDRVIPELVRKIYGARSPEKIRGLGAKYSVCPYSSMLTLLKSRYNATTYDFFFYREKNRIRKELIVYDELHRIFELLEQYVDVVNTDVLKRMTRQYRNDPETRRYTYILRSIFRKYHGRQLLEKLEEILYYLPDTIYPVFKQIVKTSVVDDENNIYYLAVDWKRFRDNAEYELYLTAYAHEKIIRKVLGDVEIIHVDEMCSKPEIVIDTSMSSLYRERNEKTYKAYAEKIAEYVLPDKLNLVVFPSYEFMHSVLEHLPDTVKNMIVPEPTSNRKGVVLDVAGGKYTEGVNIPVDQVIIAGYPYPRPEPQTRVLTRIFGREYMDYIANLRVIQTIGRLRGRGRAVLIDRRYKGFRLPF